LERLRVEQQVVDKVMQVTTIEIGQKSQVLNSPGEAECCKLSNDLVAFGDRAVIKKKALFADCHGKVVASTKDRFKTTQTLLCRGLQGRVLRRVVPDGFDLFDHTGEGGRDQFVEFTAILHLQGSSIDPSGWLGEGHKTSVHSK